MQKYLNIIKMNKKLAKITKANLEIQERGILNFWINVDYEGGCCQGVGGICLDNYDDKKQKRVGTAYGCEMIRRLLIELQVNDFSEMKGKIIWVLGDGEGLNFEPKGIESLRVNNKNSKPVVFDDIANEFS
jgi:hypothetical protein